MILYDFVETDGHNVAPSYKVGHSEETSGQGVSCLAVRSAQKASRFLVVVKGVKGVK